MRTPRSKHETHNKARKKADEIGYPEREGLQDPLQDQPKYTVGIDFGTTFSGAAFARNDELFSEDLRKRNDAITVVTQWPGQGEAGALRGYSKTLTAVWYLRQPDGTFKLKGWGWQAYFDYASRLQADDNYQGAKTQDDNLPGYFDGSAQTTNWVCPDPAGKHGFLLTHQMKLALAGSTGLELPKGLTVEKIISDYLFALSMHALQELRLTHGERESSPQKLVQYVVTVPAIWKDEQKHAMKTCCQLAGMIRGEQCTLPRIASPYDLKILTEPDAAAIYVHRELPTAELEVGDRFVLCDIGGGTSDIVIHEMRKRRPGCTRVNEIAQDGLALGGAAVDSRFMALLSRRIPVFGNFMRRNPRDVLEIYRWWNDVKSGFEGGDRVRHMPVPSSLARAWGRQHWKRHGRLPAEGAHDQLTVKAEEIIGVFQEVITPVFAKLESMFRGEEKWMFLVGGFCESPYLAKEVEKRFPHLRIMAVRCAGSAVVQGAVRYTSEGWIRMVQSRKAKYTIGFDTSEKFLKGVHDEAHMTVDTSGNKETALCEDVFAVIIRVGEDIPFGRTISWTLRPTYRRGADDGDDIDINLYRTKHWDPKYVTDSGVKRISGCRIRVPPARALREEAVLVLRCKFEPMLHVSVRGKNWYSGVSEMKPLPLSHYTDPDLVVH